MKKSNINVALALPVYLQSEHLLFDPLTNEVGLSKFLNSGRRIKGSPGEAMLFNLLSDELPGITPAYAALSALGSGLRVKKECWLRIDPIELMVDAGNICLVGRDHLLLEKTETQALLNSLNNLLKEDRLHIQAGAAQEWYLQLDYPPKILTYPLVAVVSKDIRSFLPLGDERKWWNKLTTELQMLLFQHEINAQRQTLRKPLVNSVWLWGEGQISKPYRLKSYQHIWSDNSLVKGMMSLLEKEQFIDPSSQFSIDQVEYPGNYLITLNQHVMGLESVLEIVALLINRLRDRKIHELTIYLGNGTVYNWQMPRWGFLNLRKYLG